ncbi:tyrosine-protein phosphatase [Virgibacillus sp. NKC19-3]|uniref:tyrosine-protein phosphatase n=1 Tax=Virgibacillus saliphilus TaxID=2831674 RepID=UPI001C9AF7DB|nr:tyrosine-protein phosphatase [Virgibacillus sp. NKC19-3]MBY7145119.1 tyrosine-protein phosphatase [Virgibacillus sp. NKC19-3]
METLVNFRDLGGIATKDGKKIKRNKLLRAGQLVNLSDADKKELVQDHDLKLIIDFREQSEIDKEPDDEIEGVEYIPIDVLKSGRTNSIGKDNFSKVGSIEQGDRWMISVYEQLVLDPIAQEGYRLFLHKVMEQEEGSVLFHCFAGKDRTGIAAALLLTILNVDRPVIMDDYLQTNTSRQEANKHILQDLQKYNLNSESTKAIKKVLGVDQAYLQQAFDAIEKEYNGMDHYLVNILQFGLSKQERVRKMMLE